MADQMARTELLVIIGFSIGWPILMFLQRRRIRRIGQARLLDWARGTAIAF